MSDSQVKALVGARVSHVQGPEKTSHLTQRSKGEAYAESQGWVVVGGFEDLDVSALKTSPFERPDLKVWLTERSHEWDALIFAKTDRVFRSAADCVRLAEWCKEHSKILVLVDDGIKLDYLSPEDDRDAFAAAMSKVFLLLASAFAEIEGQRFLQRARDRTSFLRNTDRWGYGLAPFGFEIVDHPSGEGKALAHDVEAQKVLHLAADRLLAGDSLTRIISDFNDQGVLTPRDHYRKRQGRPTEGNKWSVDNIRSLLSNPTTQGIKTVAVQGQRRIGKPILDSDGEPVRVGPASFDTGEWDRIQAELAQRSQAPRERRHSINPLLGIAKCAVCGKNLRQRSQKTDGATYRYYLCPGIKPCPGVSINADSAEKLVEEAFMSVHAGRFVAVRKWQPGSDESAALAQTVQTIEALREDRALGLYSSDEDAAVFRQQLKTLIAKRDRLQASPVVKAGWVVSKSDRTYSQVWPNASWEDRREMLRDAGVILEVTRSNQTNVFSDLDKVLGVGAVGEELAREIGKAAADERARHGIEA